MLPAQSRWKSGFERLYTSSYDSCMKQSIVLYFLIYTKHCGWPEAYKTKWTRITFSPDDYTWHYY